jgi:hypothetical protein
MIEKVKIVLKKGKRKKCLLYGTYVVKNWILFLDDMGSEKKYGKPCTVIIYAQPKKIFVVRKSICFLFQIQRMAELRILIIW